MSRDVRLGLIVGVGVVIAAALVYFRPESNLDSANAVTVEKSIQNNSQRTVPPAHLSTPPNR